MMFIPPMKKQAEIQRAHDLIVGAILGEAGPISDTEALEYAKFASVLCWVLNHECSDQFAKWLVAVEEFAKKQGFDFEKEK